MPIGTSDGETFKDEFEAAARPLVSGEKPVITRPQEANSMPDMASAEPVQSLDDAPLGESSWLHQIGLPSAAKAVDNVVGFPSRYMQTYQPGQSVEDDPEAVDWAANTGMNLLTAGIAAAPLKPGIGMFGGRMSQPAVNQAERLEASGYSDQAVKEISGLERGADGYWRKEFSDANATVNTEAFKAVNNDTILPVKLAKLGDVLDHPELYKVYPEAKDIPVWQEPRLVQQGNRGVYHSDPLGIDVSPMLTNEETKETLLHEVQHWIQHQEGFSLEVPDTVPSSAKDKVMRDYILENHKPTLKIIDRLTKEGNLSEARMESEFVLKDAEHRVYNNLASEVEARNTAVRSKMSNVQRKNSLATDTEDLDRDQQIVVPHKQSMIP